MTHLCSLGSLAADTKLLQQHKNSPSMFLFCSTSLPQQTLQSGYVSETHHQTMLNELISKHIPA